MGWIRQFKEYLWTPYKLEKWLPEPTRPAPPMPKCKSPRSADISEPVITLLEMLSRDEWETVVHPMWEGHKLIYLVNVYKEPVKMTVSYRQSVNANSVTYALLHFEWMTDAEKAAVNRAINELCVRLQSEMKAWNNLKSREQFKRCLEMI